MEITKLRLREFLVRNLDQKYFGEALVWEDQKKRTWKLLYYRVQEDHRVFEAWNKSRCRKEDRKGTPKSFFNSALNYLKKKALLEELKRELKYRRFQFLYPEEKQKQNYGNILISPARDKERIIMQANSFGNINPNGTYKQERIIYVVAKQETNNQVFLCNASSAKAEKCEQLFQSLQANDSIDIISAILNQGADLNMIKKYNVVKYVNYNFILGTVAINPLHMAIINKNIDCINFLIKKGAKINGYDSIPPLTLAISLYNPEEPEKWYSIIKTLLDFGADVNQCYDELERLKCETPLLMACRLNDPMIAQLLAEHGADLEFCNDKYVYPLTYSIYLQSTRMIRFLVSSKVNINKISKVTNPFATFPNSSSQKLPCFYWRSPLHMAIARESQEETFNFNFIEYLLENGANASLKEEGFLPPPLIFLIEMMSGIKPLIDYVKLFLRHNCYPNDTILSIEKSEKCELQKCRHNLYTSRSSLFIAFCKKELEVFKLLLEKGASSNFSGNIEKPLICYCLPYSVPFGEESMPYLKLILEKDANPNTFYRHNGILVSPINYFLNVCNFKEKVGLEVISLLINSGAKVALTFQKKHPFGVFLERTSHLECVYASYSKKCLNKHIPQSILKYLLDYSSVTIQDDLKLNICKYKQNCYS